MDYLSWDLSILSRAVQYNNLSGASDHVGLSQPQLSRIVAKLEDQFGFTLLDRETKRKSSWTPAAYKLAEIYTKTFQNFRKQVNHLVEGMEPEHLRIGTLEGLIPQAMEFCQKLFQETKIMVVELEVYDTNELEEKFLKNELDLVFSSRKPGHKNYRLLKTLGYQSIEPVETGELKVYSLFEYASQVHKGKARERAFVSNSLRVRQEWVDSYGGTGTIPSEVRSGRSGKKNEVPVLVLAHDHLPPQFWQKISGFL